MVKDTYEAIKDGFKEEIRHDIEQQVIENNHDWIYKAICQGVKEAFMEAIEDGSLHIDVNLLKKK